MVSDEERGKVIMFGGFGQRAEYDFLRDTWEYSLRADAWTEVAQGSSTVPGARASHSAAFHATRREMFVFGGAVRAGSGSLDDLDDLWALNADTDVWRQITPTGAAGTPTPRNEQAMVIRGDSIFIFGGLHTTGSSLTALGDTWQFHIGKNEWAEVITDASPPARFSHAGVLLRPVAVTAEELRDGAIVVPDNVLSTGGGGSSSRRLASVPQQATAMTGPGPYDKFHVVRGSEATAAPTLSVPGRSVATVLPDAEQGLHVGGRYARARGPSQTSSYSPLRSRARSLTPWNDTSHNITAEEVVAAINAEWAETDIFIVFGGRYQDASGRWSALSDLWLLRFDDAHDDFGRGDEWAVGDWVQEEVGGYPFQRSYHSLAAWEGKAVVFGGFVRLDPSTTGGANVGYVFNDLLVNDVPVLGRPWRKATVDGPAPPVRFDHSAAVVGDRMVVYGGLFQDLQPNAVWEVNLTTITTNPITEEDFVAGLPVTSFFSSGTFMIAVLMLMLLCFCGFLMSLRRARTVRRFEPGLGGGIIEIPMEPRGTPDAVVRGLAVVEYKKHLDPSAPAPSASAAVASASAAVDADSATAAPGTGAAASASAVSVAGVEAGFAAAQSTCSICLCEYEPGEKMNELPCQHRYHPDCIKQWLKNATVCPLCKRDVVTGQPSGDPGTS